MADAEEACPHDEYERIPYGVRCVACGCSWID